MLEIKKKRVVCKPAVHQSAQAKKITYFSDPNQLRNDLHNHFVLLLEHIHTLVQHENKIAN